MKNLRMLFVFSLILGTVALVDAKESDGCAKALFDGSSLETSWKLQQSGGWVIEKDGSMVCVLKDGKDRKGKPRKVGMGYIWSKEDFGDFELTMSYKLSAACNSGLFIRSNPSNPVQEGIEVQLMDDKGYLKGQKPKHRRNLNMAVYDAKAASKDASKPAGEWNQLRVVCKGPKIEVELNGKLVNEVNLDEWDTPKTNPDGSPNKFKKALKDFPRTGRIGFQNHGHPVWIRDVKIKELK